MSDLMKAYNHLDAKNPGYHQGKPRTLQVKFTSWSKRHFRITENSTEGPLVYAADIHTRKPNIVFQSTGTSQLPATVTFHSWSSKVDISIDGDSTTGRSSSRLKRDRMFPSRGLGGGSLKWRSKSFLSLSNDFECVDGSGRVLATFYSNRGISMTRAGRFEIVAPEVLQSKRVTDEVIVTGMAHVYLEYVARSSAAGAAAGAGAGAGGGGGGG